MRAVWLFVGFLVCVGLAVLNGVLYAIHGHGLSLFASGWCLLMAAVVFCCWRGVQGDA